jgi:hypothetical protein
MAWTVKTTLFTLCRAGPAKLDVKIMSWLDLAGCCEHGNELQDSTNCEEFLDYLTN